MAQTNEELLIGPLFMGGQWSGNNSDPAELILACIGYVPGEGPVLNAKVYTAQVAQLYVDQALRSQLQQNMFADLNIGSIAAYHGIIQKSEKHEILVANIFDIPGGPSAEKCLDDCIQSFHLETVPSPKFYQDQRQRIVKTYVPADGVILVAPASAPAGVEVLEDTLGLNKMYEEVHIKNAVYNSVQASPMASDVRLVTF